MRKWKSGRERNLGNMSVEDISNLLLESELSGGGGMFKIRL